MRTAGEVPAFSFCERKLHGWLRKRGRNQRLDREVEWVLKQDEVGYDHTGLTGIVNPCVVSIEFGKKVLDGGGSGVDGWVDGNHLPISQNPCG